MCHHHIAQACILTPGRAPFIGLSAPFGGNVQRAQVQALEALSAAKRAVREDRACHVHAGCSVCGVRLVRCIRCGRPVTGAEARHVADGYRAVHCCPDCEAPYRRTLDAVRRLFDPEGGSR